MNHLNSLILEGYVARKPELVEPLKGFKVCKFPVAVCRYIKDADGECREEVSYFENEAYGKMAEVIFNNCQKGQEIRLVGRLKSQLVVDSDGKKNSQLFIVVEHADIRKKYNNEHLLAKEETAEVVCERELVEEVLNRR